jgi:dihydrofolate reductase
MRVSIIVAVAANGVIGAGERLPWRLPADLARFKKLTMGHHLLMGRKTFESIGRALPGRRTVVISRHRPQLPDQVLLARSLEEAVEIARQGGDDEAFVAGGGQIYRLALPVADRLYLTRVGEEFNGDTRFAEPSPDDWRQISREDHEPDDRNPYAYSFIVFERVSRLGSTP